jgi:hypothetical protein
MEMATDPTVTVATGFRSLDETPMAIASFMGCWCRINDQLFLARVGGKEKERVGKTGGVDEIQAARSSALMQN